MGCLLVSSLLLLFIGLCGADVTLLESSNFDDLVSSKVDVALVAYTMDGCGHCQALKPTWSQLGESFSSNERALIGVIDCTSRSNPLCKGVFSFPTIKVFRPFKGEPIVFTGQRTLEAFSLLVQKNLGPALRQVDGSDEAENVDPEGTVFIARGDKCDQEELTVVARRFRHDFFFFFDSRSHNQDCVVEAIRKGANERSLWSQSTSSVSLSGFVEMEGVPLLSPFKRHVHSTSQRPVVFLFHEGPTPDESSSTTMRAVARRLRMLPSDDAEISEQVRDAARKILFCTETTSEWDGIRAGVKAPYPRVAIVDMSRLNHHYVFEGTLSENDLFQWLMRFARQQLPRTMVSEPEPDSDDSVVRIVGSSFSRVVENATNTTDVLVMFHSPHCGSSVAARPFWEKLLPLLKQSAPGVLVAEADGWANDWPDWFQISGLPDWLLFPADNRRMWKRYGGVRDAKPFLEWLARFALSPVDVDLVHRYKEEL